MTRMRALLAGAIIPLALGACTGGAGGGSQVIATVQPGDSQLSCDQLAGQMAQMDQIIGNGSGSTAGAIGSAASTGLSAAGGALSGVEQALGNVASNAANSLSANASQQQSTQVQMAQQRKAQLMSLYTQKKC